ncbi:MAG: glycosyltransferase family 4 protein [Candidatus Aegiribacteria sp.]|nr:glycosyltransferase family 4 protein [Candidatus Aegiribacteria sp.]
MKIALVGPFPPFRGGIAQFTAKLYDTLTERYPEHTFTPVSFSRLYPSFLFPGTSQMEPLEGQSSKKAVEFLDSCNPMRWISTRRFFRKHSFDWIITQWWHPFFAPALLNSIPADIRTAAICHNVLPHEGFPLSRRFTSRFISRMDLLVTHSASDLDEIESIIGRSDILKLYLPLYNQYLNTDMDRIIARQELGYSANAQIVLFFGLIRPYKGLMDLIEAMKLLPRRISLLIVGECYSDKPEILKTIKSEELSGRVRWIDEFVPDNQVAKYFLSSDIVTLPYRHATQSAVAQIALSFGKILVLTDTGGLSELVDVGRTGFLAEPESPTSIAESILAGFELLSDPDLPERIDKKASEFSWTVYAQKLMDSLK